MPANVISDNLLLILQVLLECLRFYPVTAIMIVLLAILNDGAILSIAYDRSLIAGKPIAWDMHLTLGLATILGLMGVVETFGLFYIADHILHLSRDVIQSFIYLKLSVSGHLTVFVTRTRGPFWSHRPSFILLGAVAGTQFVATLITVYGLLMSPIGWKWALLVWGYSLFWFLVEDRMKLFGYRVLDKEHSGVLSKARSAAPA